MVVLLKKRGTLWFSLYKEPSQVFSSRHFQAISSLLGSSQTFPTSSQTVSNLSRSFQFQAFLSFYQLHFGFLWLLSHGNASTILPFKHFKRFELRGLQSELLSLKSLDSRKSNLKSTIKRGAGRKWRGLLKQLKRSEAAQFEHFTSHFSIKQPIRGIRRAMGIGLQLCEALKTVFGFAESRVSTVSSSVSSPESLFEKRSFKETCSCEFKGIERTLNGL